MSSFEKLYLILVGASALLGLVLMFAPNKQRVNLWLWPALGPERAVP